MKKLLYFLLVMIPIFGISQNFEYQVLFEGIGDNREYFSGKAHSQTILGSRGAFEVGFETDNHRIRGGLSHLLEFGSDLNYHVPKLTLYYEYSNEKKDFLFGSFPRRAGLMFNVSSFHHLII